MSTRRRVLGPLGGSVLNARSNSDGDPAGAAGKTPSILNPLARKATGGAGKNQSRSSWQASRSNKKAHNTTLAHQPIGKSNWLRGDRLGASTAYDAWRDDSGRRRDEGDGDEYVGADLEVEAGRFNPEEVDNLVSLIAEREDADLTVSSSEDDEGGWHTAAGDESAGETRVRRNPLGEDDGADAAGEVVEEIEAPASSLQPCAASGAVEAVFGNGGPVDLELSASSHMVIVDRVVKLELEKEKSARRLGEWATCAGELQRLFQEKARECDVKDAVVVEMRRQAKEESSKRDREAASLRAELEQERLKFAEAEGALRQEVSIKEELLRESREDCRKLRAALVDAELELDRHEKALGPRALPRGGGDGSAERGWSGGDREEGTSEGARRGLEAAAGKDERIMKQDFELQRYRVQVHQQGRQIQMLTAEIGRLRNAGQALPVPRGQDGEKGHLIQELAHQIEEGSREIKLIQTELRAANPAIFEE